MGKDRKGAEANRRESKGWRKEERDCSLKGRICEGGRKQTSYPREQTYWKGFVSDIQT